MGSSRTHSSGRPKQRSEQAAIVAFFGTEEASRLCGTLECKQRAIVVFDRGPGKEMRYKMRLPAGASPRVPEGVRASGGSLDELKANFLAALAPHLATDTG